MDKMSKKTKKIIFAILAVILIAVIISYPSIKQRFFPEEAIETSANPAPPAAQRQPINVNAMIVKTENLDDNFITVGTILPDEEVDLSFEVAGKIMKIYFQEGTEVKKGQLLAKVNDATLQAELKKIQAQLPLAKEQVFRQKSLLEKDAVSKEAYELAATELAKFEADVNLIEARIAQTELRAPFDGVIGLRAVSEGQYVMTDFVVAKLTKTIPLKIEFSVNERQASSIREGEKLSFRLQDNPNTYTATVYALESNVDIKTRTLKARAIFSNYGGRLKPGRSVSIELQLDEIKNAITAPSQAITEEMGRTIAYVYRSGKAETVELTKGLRTEAKVQITQGLKVGDTLITTGIMQLRHGMPVTLNIN
jgi:membrane fusion protein (multidrug efflux system)